MCLGVFVRPFVRLAKASGYGSGALDYTQTPLSARVSTRVDSLREATVDPGEATASATDGGGAHLATVSS